MTLAKTLNANIARQVFEVVTAVELQNEGHLPRAVSVVLCGRTLVITLEGVLSQFEQELIKSSTGAAQVQEFHQQLFLKEPTAFWREISRITGLRFRTEASSDDPVVCACVNVFGSGTVVNVSLLEDFVENSSWSTAQENELAQQKETGVMMNQPVCRSGK